MRRRRRVRSSLATCCQASQPLKSLFPLFSAAARTTKGKVMERRILKDFQIGFVENLKQEMNESESGRDIFSSLAKVIGRKKTQKG